MLQAEIRSALITHVRDAFKAAFPTIAIVFPGEPFNWNDPPSVYVEFEIDLAGGNQIGMSAEPRARKYGYVYATTSMKSGQGTLLASQITDWFNERLGFAVLGSGKLVLFEPLPNTPTPPAGWHSEQAKFFFHANP